MPTNAAQGHNSDLTVQPLGYALGAEIQEIDLTATLDDSVIDSIQGAWNENHIILFREQTLTPDTLVAFAGRFGDLDRHDATPHYRLEGYPEILQITNKLIDSC